jgi:hypothetical protein
MSSRALFPVFPAFTGIHWLLATAHAAESATPVVVADEKLFRGKQAGWNRGLRLIDAVLAWPDEEKSGQDKTYFE